MSEILLQESRNVDHSIISSGKYDKLIFLFLFFIMAMFIGPQGRVLADLITIEATGTISSIHAEDDDGSDISGDFESFLPFGFDSSFSATIIYDLNVADQDAADPRMGIYDYVTPGGNFTWDIDGTVFSGGGGAMVRIHDDDSSTPAYPYDYFRIAGHPVILPDGWSATNPFLNSLIMSLDDTHSNVFSTDALPTALSLTDFEGKTIMFYTYSNVYGTLIKPSGSFSGEDLWFKGNIESLSTSRTYTDPIPEPATMLLLGTGLLGLAVVRGRFKR